MDAVHAFCAAEIDPDRLERWEREARGVDAGFWDAVARLGWFGLGLPERAGGSGLGLVEVASLLRECARGLVPRAVIGAVRGAWALARLDPDAPELPDVAAGRIVVTLALDEEAARSPDHFETRIERRAGTASLSGAKWYVPNGLHADLNIVATR